MKDSDIIGWELLKQQAEHEIQMLPSDPKHAAAVRQLKSELEAFCNMEPGEYFARETILNGLMWRSIDLRGPS